MSQYVIPATPKTGGWMSRRVIRLSPRVRSPSARGLAIFPGLRVQPEARIDLLITDVGLPGGMNGRPVADAARVSRPKMKALFVTGCAENAAVGDGRLDAGMEVITKPFVMAALGDKVREMIDR